MGSINLKMVITDDQNHPNNGFHGMIGQSAAMREVYNLTEQVAKSSATVLLTGETGTGKELIARAIHDLSPRGSGPFVRVNCGALSESLLESELFGHVKGAFTSANENRTGRFEAAHGGTIFLDEINSVSFQLQVKLLRVLQEHEFERVGDTRTVQVDCRFIAATNRDLLTEIEEENFREDLYYRLNVVPIYIPALRERTEDIPDLVKYFLKNYAAQEKKTVLKPLSTTIEMLKAYSWPGNVRELQNYIERAVVLSEDKEFKVEMLPPHVRGMAPVRIGKSRTADLPSLCKELVSRGFNEFQNSENGLHPEIVSMVEKELIMQMLKICQGIQTKTATRLGINRNTLHKKIEDYDLHSEAR